MRPLRHGFFSIFLCLTVFSFLKGGAWLWLGFATLSFAAVSFDIFLPDDLGSHADSSPRIMNFYLFFNLPLLYFNLVAFNWQMSPYDFLGLGSIFPAKALRTAFETVGAYFSIGLLIAAAGTVTAHELVHRVWDKKSVIVGRWLLAPSCDTAFAIEHVYGHHANVATDKDPSSARRGESFWSFFPRSTWGAFVGAWAIEKKRLEKRQQGAVWSRHNMMLRGQLMSLCVLMFFVGAQGWFGIGSFFIASVSAKLYLELINYIEHYGLERKPGEPVQAQHSWNCNATFSLYCLYNLPRHPHHHAKGHLPYWKLEANPDAPTLPYGYMTMILLALFPPVYKSLMDPRIPKAS